MPCRASYATQQRMKRIRANLNLIFGDTLVLDRWRWINRRLPQTNEPLKLLDVGCGSGAFTIKSALKGYKATGLSWDAANQDKAARRASSCGVKELCSFNIFDARELDHYPEKDYDVIINCENIEHIINDAKLMRDMGSHLKPGGYLLLTTPNFFYRSISHGDNGPFLKEETGWHVKRGYIKTELQELCEIAGLSIEEISYCSGYTSQKITGIIRMLNSTIGTKLAWLVTLPLRIIPPIADPLIEALTNYPNFSICLVACKPRFPSKHQKSTSR